MAGQPGGVAVSKASSHLAKIEEDILGLPGPEFEALAEWFNMVLTLRRAVTGTGQKCALPTVNFGSVDLEDVPASEADAPGADAEVAAAVEHWGVPRESQQRRRTTKIHNKRYENTEVVGSATGSGTPEPSHGSQDGEPREELQAPEAQDAAGSATCAEGSAILALCGGGLYRGVAEGRRALQSLCGEWRDTAGSVYEVSLGPSGDRLNVSTRRPGAGRAMCTKGLIRLQKRTDSEGVRIAWGAKASFVLVSPNDQPDVVQWASPDNYRRPFEWRRSSRRRSGGGGEDWPNE